MKIVGIISSPHKQGNTAVLVREALKGAADHGSEVLEIFLPDYKIEYCRGCFVCMSKGRCPIKDDFEYLKQQVYLADGLIISSPCYGLAPNAMMKNFMDRIGMFTVYTSSLGGKHAVGISTAGAMGAKQVAKALTGMVTGGVFQRGYCSGTLGAAIGWGSVHGDEKQLKKAYALGERIAKDIRSKNTYMLQNLFGRLLNALILKRVFRSNIVENSAAGMNAVYENLRNRGLIQ